MFCSQDFRDIQWSTALNSWLDHRKTCTDDTWRCLRVPFCFITRLGVSTLGRICNLLGTTHDISKRCGKLGVPQMPREKPHSFPRALMTHLCPILKFLCLTLLWEGGKLLYKCLFPIPQQNKLSALVSRTWFHLIGVCNSGQRIHWNPVIFGPETPGVMVRGGQGPDLVCGVRWNYRCASGSLPVGWFPNHIIGLIQGAGGRPYIYSEKLVTVNWCSAWENMKFSPGMSGSCPCFVNQSHHESQLQIKIFQPC